MGIHHRGSKSTYLKIKIAAVLGVSGLLNPRVAPAEEAYLSSAERGFVQAYQRYLKPQGLAEILSGAASNPCTVKLQDAHGRSWSLNDFNELDQKWLWLRSKALQAHQSLQRLEPQLNRDMKAFDDQKAFQVTNLFLQEALKDNTPIFALAGGRWRFALFAYLKDTMDGRYFESKYFHDIPDLQKSTVRQNLTHDLQDRGFDLDGQFLELYLQSSSRAAQRVVAYEDIYHLFGPLMAVNRAADTSIASLHEERQERVPKLEAALNVCLRNSSASRDPSVNRMLGMVGAYPGMALRDFAYNQCSHDKKMKLYTARAETSLKLYFVTLLKRQAFLGFAGLLGGLCQRMAGAVYHENGQSQYFVLRH